MPPARIQRSAYKEVPSRWWAHGADPYGPPTGDWYSIQDYVASELLQSEGHQVSKLGDTADDIGGDFALRKREYKEESSLGGGPLPFTTEPSSERYFYAPKARFEHIAWWANVFQAHPEFTSDSQMDTMGTTAISRIIPTNPLVSAAAFLGEMREGLPSLGIETWSSRTAKARAAGGDYLNAEFGWKPLISDIQKFAYIVKNSDRIVAQYERDAGKLLRRRYDWPSDQTTEVIDMGTGHNPVPWGTGGGMFRPDHVGRLTRTRTTKTRRWLEATFTYYLPPQGSRARDIAIANKLYGVRITPDVLWQLTPWSWAADWVTNAGDIASNVSAFMSDGLVMPYAYLMEEKIHSDEWNLTQVGYKSYPGMQSFRQTFVETVRKRRRASPFGFGFDFDGLTTRQGAILSALAISRRR